MHQKNLTGHALYERAGHNIYGNAGRPGPLASTCHSMHSREGAATAPGLLPDAQIRGEFHGYKGFKGGKNHRQVRELRQRLALGEFDVAASHLTLLTCKFAGYFNNMGNKENKIDCEARKESRRICPGWMVSARAGWGWCSEVPTLRHRSTAASAVCSGSHVTKDRRACSWCNGSAPPANLKTLRSAIVELCNSPSSGLTCAVGIKSTANHAETVPLNALCRHRFSAGRSQIT